MTGVQTNDFTSTYSIKVLYDNTPYLATRRSIKKARHLYSASDSAACGLELQVNTIYLMKGRLTSDGANNLRLEADLCTTYAETLPQVPTAAEAKQLFTDLYKSKC